MEVASPGVPRAGCAEHLAGRLEGEICHQAPPGGQEKLKTMPVTTRLSLAQTGPVKRNLASMLFSKIVSGLCLGFFV